MDREIYISGGAVSLAEYLPADARDCYDCWLDPDVQSGYNYAIKQTFKEFADMKPKGRFFAVIVENETGNAAGVIGLSPEGSPPDLAIRLFRPYRGKGYGTEAFLLGIAYCFDALKLDKIYAGCYQHNAASLKMLAKCGFEPHPEGNVNEKHYLTGEPLVQYDYVLYAPPRG